MMKLRLAYLYSDLLNIYGDIGNIICLKQRAKWHGIDIEVDEVSLNETQKQFTNFDLFFIGGGQDSQQTKVAQDLTKRSDELKESLISKESVALAICGGYQILGKSYQTSENEIIPGLSILDIETKAPALIEGRMQDRLVSNVVAKLLIEINCYSSRDIKNYPDTIVGFENHSGRTFINSNSDTKPLAKVIKGSGNNAEDSYEGVNFKNIFGTYLHGSFLPKNPHFCDELLYRALKHSFKRQNMDWDPSFKFNPLNDSLELEAHRKALVLQG